ncbi:MAG: radical SAM family heme chaperone HemW [Clostridia bacterium]|nr:radical SAM family heme chaperone HemW [Clostridia bacterium]
MTGFYVHIPFCKSKCPYCDFYSITTATDTLKDTYTDEICRRIEAFPPLQADTLYFGGGTPSLLGGKRLARIIETARHHGLTTDAEITLEANPADELYDTFAAFTAAGGNRLSLGMQATDAASLHALGRRHTPTQLDVAVADAKRAGIENFSLDIMLATPSQTAEHVKDAVARCAQLGASHVSAYLLKLESGTPFFEKRDSLSLPDEDEAAELYLLACDELERAGFRQYEISNFAKSGRESRHNFKYWNGDDYIGLGPAAHSFYGGKRWYFERDLNAFLQGGKPLPEDPDSDIRDNSEEEYAMLRLRLTDGLRHDLFAERFSKPLPAAWRKAATSLPRSLVTVDEDTIALTRDGFLVSDAIISRILWG